MLGADASTVNVLAAQSGVQSTKRFSDLLRLTLFCNLQVNEAASRGTSHLPLGLFDKESLGGPHQGRTCFEGDGFDVSGDESVVRGGGDDGVHIKKD